VAGWLQAAAYGHVWLLRRAVMLGWVQVGSVSGQMEREPDVFSFSCNIVHSRNVIFYNSWLQPAVICFLGRYY
jgi:type II secretory pathway component PulF